MYASFETLTAMSYAVELPQKCGRLHRLCEFLYPVFLSIQLDNLIGKHDWHKKIDEISRNMPIFTSILGVLGIDVSSRGLLEQPGRATAISGIGRTPAVIPSMPMRLGRSLLCQRGRRHCASRSCLPRSHRLRVGLPRLAMNRWLPRRTFHPCDGHVDTGGIEFDRVWPAAWFFWLRVVSCRSRQKNRARPRRG